MTPARSPVGWRVRRRTGRTPAARRPVDGEEVARHDPGGLLAQERPPARRDTPRRRVKTVSTQHSPDRAGRHPNAKAQQFAVDPLVAPAWVLASKPDDELLEVVRERGPSHMGARVPPAPADQAPVPAQQRLGLHQEHRQRGRGSRLSAASSVRVAGCSLARDAGGAAPPAGGVTPGSRSPWPLPTGSRAGSAQGCGAAPGRPTTRPHETATDESEQTTADRNL